MLLPLVTIDSLTSSHIFFNSIAFSIINGIGKIPGKSSHHTRNPHLHQVSFTCLSSKRPAMSESGTPIPPRICAHTHARTQEIRSICSRSVDSNRKNTWQIQLCKNDHNDHHEHTYVPHHVSVCSDIASLLIGACYLPTVKDSLEL